MIPERLPESTTLLYSELLQQCWQAAPESRGISFVKKTLKDRQGHRIWLLQLQGCLQDLHAIIIIGSGEDTAIFHPELNAFFLLDEIECNVPKDRHILRAMVFANAALVFTKRHV